MQLTPEVVKHWRHDLDNLITKVDHQTAQIADHTAKLENLKAACQYLATTITEIENELKETADTAARFHTTTQELLYNWGLLLEEQLPAYPLEAAQPQRQQYSQLPPPPPPRQPPLLQPVTVDITVQGTPGTIHPRAPQVCLDDPFTELRVWAEAPGTRGGSRPNVLWPYCTECACWTDEKHHSSKRHQQALAHWYPDMSLPARRSRLHAAPQQEPQGYVYPLSGPPPLSQEAKSNLPPPPQAHTKAAPTGLGAVLPDHKVCTPIPLFSKSVDKLQHDAFCRLFKPRPCDAVKDLSRTLNFKGIPFQEWWHQIAPTASLMQWQIKLWGRGSPKELVQDADADYLGKFLYQHIDFEGSYHVESLQDPPPNA